MAAGEETALVNGFPVELEDAPFVEYNVFYYPLEEMVRLCGGASTWEDGRLLIEIGIRTFSVVPGSPVVTDDSGAVWTNKPSDRFFTTADTRYWQRAAMVPILRDGTVYAPIGFDVCGEGLVLPFGSWTMYPESETAILSGREPQQSFMGFTLLTEFAEVPAERRSQLTCRGVRATGIREAYDEVEYRGDGFSVFVLRLAAGHEDIDGLDGKISAIVVDDPRIPTGRGLRCGDSAARAWALYGWELVGAFGCDVENGVVTRYGWRSYYTACGGMTTAGWIVPPEL